MRRLLIWLGFHICHPGIPHTNPAGRLVMTCYGCSKEREIKVRLLV
jgi:hypothetical protein